MIPDTKQDGGGGADGDLLAAFAGRGREEAFAEIVRRHGGLVLSVCRSVLGNAADAEDAAQAVFLTLAQRAPALTGRATLVGWLHRTAWYVAARAAEAAAIRRRREEEAARMRQDANSPGTDDVPLDALHAALENLPETYRVPLLLHHIERRTERETAEIVGCSAAAASVRLSRGRQILRDRLLKRGIAMSGAGLSAALAGKAPAAAPPAFVTATSHMAGLVLAGQAASAAVPATVAALTKGAMTMLFWAKVKLAVLGISAALLLVGAGVGAFWAAAGEPGAGGAADPNAAAPRAPIGGAIVDQLQLALSADKTECGPDGTVEFIITLANRGKEPLNYLKYPLLCGPHLKITGPDGKLLQYVNDPNVRFSVPAPHFGHVKELQAGATWEHVERVFWQVLDPPLEDRNRVTGKVIRRHEGWGWDIRKPGRYTVVAWYGPKEHAKKIQEKYQTRVWDGEVSSNAVALTVKR